MSKQAWLDEILATFKDEVEHQWGVHDAGTTDAIDAEVHAKAAINAKFDEAFGEHTEVGSQYWKEGFNARGARARKAWYTQEAEEPAA